MGAAHTGALAPPASTATAAAPLTHPPSLPGPRCQHSPRGPTSPYVAGAAARKIGRPVGAPKPACLSVAYSLEGQTSQLNARLGLFYSVLFYSDN